MYPPDDPTRPCRPKAGQGLVMITMMIVIMVTVIIMMEMVVMIMLLLIMNQGQRFNTKRLEG